MNDDQRSSVDVRIREHYDAMWSSSDPWLFDTSAYEQRRFAHQIKLLSDRRYSRALEIGCGAGAFSRRLAGLTDQLVALDVSAVAIEKARAEHPALANTTFLAANVMEFNPCGQGPWDLVVLSETIYCLGWLYPLFDVGWMLSQLRDAMTSDGRLLLSNTFGHDRDYLLRPWLIKTYHDLVRNIGFELELNDTFVGTKDDTRFQVLTSRFKVSSFTEPAPTDPYAFSTES